MGDAKGAASLSHAIMVSMSEAYQQPQTAEALMRSRFAAFKRADPVWLLESWHPSTRPESIDLSDNPEWRGLQILQTQDGLEGDSHGAVEFRATYLHNGDLGILHERSRFVRQNGSWFYLDGEILSP